MQTDLVARLRADAELSALLGAKGNRSAVDYDTRPDAGGLPALVLSDVSTQPIYTQGGRAGQESIVQIDVWAATPLEAINAIDRAVTLMEAEAEVGATYFHRAFLNTGPRTMRAEDLPGGERVHRRSADIRFHHKAA